MKFVGITCTETASGVIIDLADPQPEDIKLGDICWGLSRQNRYAGHTITKKPYTIAQHSVEVSRIAEAALRPGNEFHDMFSRYLDEAINHFATEDVFKEDAETEPTPAAIEFRKWADFKDTLRRDLDDSKIRMIAFHGVMHDFAEAYLVDLPTPVKRLPGVHEAYRVWEHKMDDVIFRKFELGYADKWPDFRAFGEVVVKWADMVALKIEAYHMMPSRGLAWNLPQEQPSLQVLNAFRWPVDSEQACAELHKRFEELRPEPAYF